MKKPMMMTLMHKATLLLTSPDPKVPIDPRFEKQGREKLFWKNVLFRGSIREVKNTSTNRNDSDAETPICVCVWGIIVF